MKKLIQFATLAVIAAGFASCAMSPQDRLTVNDKKINKIIAQMTLEEKVEMLHSKTNMSSEGVPRLGIQDIKYTDGPFGIREENGDGFRSLGWTLDSATYFPTGSALAATWSKEMAYKNGWAEDDVLTSGTTFLTHSPTILVGHFLRPSSCKSRTCREISCRVESPT